MFVIRDYLTIKQPRATTKSGTKMVYKCHLYKVHIEPGNPNSNMRKLFAILAYGPNNSERTQTEPNNSERTQNEPNNSETTQKAQNNSATSHKNETTQNDPKVLESLQNSKTIQYSMLWFKKKAYKVAINAEMVTHTNKWQYLYGVPVGALYNKVMGTIKAKLGKLQY